MHTTEAAHLKAKIEKMMNTDDWVEKMTSIEMRFLCHTNPDLCEEKKTDESGRTRTLLKGACNNRYRMYELLRSKRRCPKNQHGEVMLKKMEKRDG
jgi:hypothetical protein